VGSGCPAHGLLPLAGDQDWVRVVALYQKWFLN
jgi:hypothetical protein